MGLSKPRKVAVVGGGLTGIASFWALQGSSFDVHLFEASPALGGHIKTLALDNNGNQMQVDTELPTFSPIACPNLTSLLRYLKIPTTEVPFSFGVLDDMSSVFKWHISILKSILLCPRLLCKLETYRLLLDVISLRCLAADVLTEPVSENAGSQESTERFLQEKGYPNGFRDRYLTPLLSTLWRTNAGKFLPNLPVKVLAHSLHEHQLLFLCENMPKWRRIDPGVRYLVDALAKSFPLERLHLQTKVNEISRRSKSQYDLLTSDGKHSRFDHVILTVDGPEILRLLCSTVTEEENRVLQSLRVTRNIAVLHSDFPATTDNVSPDYDFVMASSNYRRRVVPPKFCLRYDVNVLQDIPASRFGEVFITFNSLSPPHPSLVQGVWEFTEPEPSAESLGAQSRLALIQNTRGLSYGFCWTGRGLLEDSITSGLRIAVEDLGATVPFNVALHPHPLDSIEFSYKHSGLRYNLVRTALEAVRTIVLVLEIALLLLGRIEAPILKARAPLNRASRT